MVLKGAQALAAPMSIYSGHWQISEDLSKQQNLSELADYLERSYEHAVDVNAFRAALAVGWYFDSNIPTGYGAGSSGALIAAIFDQFGKKNHLNLLELKTLLGGMESFFHGSSSGVDPLICYQQETYLLEGKNSIKAVSLPSWSSQQYSFFLVDTGIKRKTGTYVNLFLKQCEETTYMNRIRHEGIPLSNRAIKHFLAADFDQLYNDFAAISTFQWDCFGRMIPQTMHSPWLMGMRGAAFKLKICGAGGGGFLLGMTKDLVATQAIFPDLILINDELKSSHHSI